MMRKSTGSRGDSGFSGSQESSLHTFFDRVVPGLEEVITRFDDPTIELGQPKQIEAVSFNNPCTESSQTFTVAEKKYASLDELTHIVNILKADNAYSQKLAKIMLNGMEKTLDQFYPKFLQSGLPRSFVPIIKMNPENTPYVEFLLKSDASDEGPSSQLQDFSDLHYAYGRFVIEYLWKSAHKERLVALKQRAPNNHLPISGPTKVLKSASASASSSVSSCASSSASSSVSATTTTPAKKISEQKKPKTSLPSAPSARSAPMCSTPLSDKRPPPMKRMSQTINQKQPDENLNDSRRLLPTRACKNNSRYQK